MFGGSVARGVLAVAAVLTLVAPAAADGYRTPASITSSAVNSQTYIDGLGDAVAGGMDIKQVTVSNNDAGNIHFSIEIPTHATLPTTKRIGVYLDVDLNPNNNESGFEYLIWVENTNTIRLDKWDGSKYVQVSAPGLTHKYGSGETIDINRVAFGSPSTFDFAVNAWNRTGSTTTRDDRAPTTSRWRYSVIIGAPPPPPPPPRPPPPPPPTPKQRLNVAGWEHDVPRSGDVFATLLRVRDPSTNQNVSKGSVSCGGRLGARGLRGRGYYSFDDRGFLCNWKLPESGVGKTLVATETVSYKGATVSQTFQGTVKPLLKTLKITRVEHPQVVAGTTFQASISASLIRPSGAHDSIRPARATCSARVQGGDAIKSRRPEVFPTGVRCTWEVPSSARGRMLAFMVTIRSHNQTAKRVFSARAR